MLLSVLSCSGVAKDYFVRPDGDDTAMGDSQSRAWRTIEHVNAQRLQPGDRVCFEAGKSFVGQLRLTAEDAGNASAPVTLGSFGRGRATILATDQAGITVENTGGIVIRDLMVVGTGRTNNSSHGIHCDNTLTNGSRLSGLRIENVEVSGFGRFGIWVSGAPAGFEHVRVERCVLRDNLRGGMEIAGRLPYDSSRYAHADVEVRHCQAFNNTGDPDYARNHSGSGIVLYQVDDGLIEHCQAWNNGALCGSSGGGPVGLWTCASRRVVIQHCESFANRTSGADGGGFDLDGGCEECVLQYNYSHDNEGPGLMAYTYPYASHRDRDNVIRFNLSKHDARKGPHYAGLWVRSNGESMTGLQIYNNTIVTAPPARQAAFVHGRNVGAALRNNLFVTLGETIPLCVEAPHDAIRLENNLYWRAGRPFEVAWGEHTYLSLEAWRAHTGQEMLGSEPLGLFVDPRWNRVPASRTTSKPTGFAVLKAYRPSRDSPASMAGLDLRTRFGQAPDDRDLLGRPLRALGRLPIGAIGAERE